MFPLSVSLNETWASLVAQTVKNLPAMQETQVRSLSWEDPLEKGMATHSIILARRIPWTKDPGRQHKPIRSMELSNSLGFSFTIYEGVAKSRTRLSN